MEKSNGWSEAYRIRIRAIFAEKIATMARRENRTMQGMIRTLAREGLFYRLYPQIISALTEGNYELLDSFIDDGFGEFNDRWQRSQVPPEIKWAVWERDNFTCKHCGSHQMLTTDHVIPVSKGGKPTLKNLQTLCKKCNGTKGSKLNHKGV